MSIIAIGDQICPTDASDLRGGLALKNYFFLVLFGTKHFSLYICKR